ncbi:DUF4168 domain-containing protein [Echinicola rosea]|nr:DUF4168 domain-containing protein [Echinicola rosea]
MINFKQMTKVSLFSALLVMLGFSLQAQQISPQAPQNAAKASDFTDEEYDKFVNINAELIPVQQEVQGKMMDAIKAEGLEVQRFQELAQAQQSGSLKDASDDPEEIGKFNKAGQQVMAIQKEVQTKAQGLIEENDLSVQKFQQMSMAYNQSQEVRAKVDTLISEKMEEQ